MSVASKGGESLLSEGAMPFKKKRPNEAEKTPQSNGKTLSQPDLRRLRKGGSYLRGQQEEHQRVLALREGGDPFEKFVFVLRDHARESGRS